MPTLTAQYTGACANCDYPINAGDQIAAADDGWRHTSCPTDDQHDMAADAYALTQPRCPRCTGNHPGEC